MGILERMIGNAISNAASTAAREAVRATTTVIQENARAKREQEREKREYELKQKQAECELEWKKQEAYYDHLAGGAVSNNTSYSEIKVDGKVTPNGSIQMTTTKTKYYEKCPCCLGANAGEPICIYCGASLIESADITRTKTDGNN